MVPKANITPQDIVPQPVQQTADAHQLGTFLKVYKASLLRTILGATVFLGAAVLFLAGGIFATDATTRVKIILLVLGVLFLGMAMYLAFTVAQAVNQQVYLFQQGIVIEKGGRLEPFPWNQTAEVWQSVIRRYRYGIYVGTTSVYTVRRLDGYQIKLGNLTKGIAELGPGVVQGITRALVPRAWYAIQCGQTLSFAPFSVNQQGIGNGREWLLWPQVQAVDVKQGRVSVKKVGTSRAWGTALVGKVPNFPVFLTVVEELRRQAGG
jgi:hypothetical protein